MMGRNRPCAANSSAAAANSAVREPRPPSSRNPITVAAVPLVSVGRPLANPNCTNLPPAATIARDIRRLRRPTGERRASTSYQRLDERDARNRDVEYHLAFGGHRIRRFTSLQNVR
jgi:hypothetical protein